MAWRISTATQASDTWMAAVCLLRRLPLLTYNQPDFAECAKHEDLRLL